MLTSLHQPVLHWSFHWSGIGVKKSVCNRGTQFFITGSTLAVSKNCVPLLETNEPTQSRLLQWRLVDRSSRIISEPALGF